jgi:DNA-directed RNA polymerase specialized sigma24 family protein
MTDRNLETIYDAHFRALYRFFYYKVLVREIAEDLTSDTFTRFVEILQTKDYQEVRDPVKYLYGIAKLVLIQY